ncbi:MAG: tetratricopeptide repeat protein [Desulfatibacillaceae bacterium]
MLRMRTIRSALVLVLVLSGGLPVQAAPEESGFSTRDEAWANYEQYEKLLENGENLRAARWGERILPAFRDAYGELHPSVVAFTNNLGLLFLELGMNDGAEQLLAESLEKEVEIHGMRDPAVAESLDNLAEVYFQTGRCGQAVPLYRMALPIWKRESGPDHPRIAATMGKLGWCEHKLGNNNTAERLLQGSLAMLEKALDGEDERVAQASARLAEFHEAVGDPKTAAAYARRTTRILEAIRKKKARTEQNLLHRAGP